MTSEKDLITAYKSMPTGKSPGHNSLTKDFYEHFWDDLKFYFINSLKQAKIDGHLSIFQRQAIIKLIAKKDRDILNTFLIACRKTGACSP